MMRTDNTCCCVGVLIGIALIGVLFGIFYVKKTSNDITELKQVHVIFSHGERTPKLSELESFPLNIHRNEPYHPYGYDALTNDGKMMMFEFGEKLRNRYDDFIKTPYRQEETFTRTTDTDISKIGALLVLAGLWPVSQNHKWTDLAWQPVPYKNPAASEDFMLFDSSCPRYIEEKERVTEIFVENTLPSYSESFLRLSTVTGKNMTLPVEVLELSNLLRSQEHNKLKNPKWYKNMKKTIRDIVKMEYNLMFQNVLMKRLSAGPVLNKILTDSKKRIDDDKQKNIGVKMQMYSGSLENIASILTATKLAKPNRPKFVTAFIAELHYRKTSNDYGYKIYVWEHDLTEPTLLMLPQCDSYCSISEFERILENILVTDYMEECKLFNK